MPESLDQAEWELALHRGRALSPRQRHHFISPALGDIERIAEIRDRDPVDDDMVPFGGVKLFTNGGHLTTASATHWTIRSPPKMSSTRRYSPRITKGCGLDPVAERQRDRHRSSRRRPGLLANPRAAAPTWDRAPGRLRAAAGEPDLEGDLDLLSHLDQAPRRQLRQA
jgi:hypothetical protein